MSTTILATKLFRPPPRPDRVVRGRLVERLDEGLHRKLTVLAAPAGFGKTTLLAGWLATTERPAAWVSLDEAEADPIRFLTYLVAAVQSAVPGLGEGVTRALRSPQPPPVEPLLTAIVNELAGLSHDLTLVLDDYHLVESDAVARALAFLVEGLPPRTHLVLATRRAPRLPLARLRARAQLTELGADDLRFTTAEAAEFLERTVGVELSAREIEVLEARTEGWIAGLQLAALSMRGHEDAAAFIASFDGGHRFVLDYLVEEVLQREPAGIQDFLTRTSILDRLCGPLCDAVLADASVPGQATLAYLERANLFVVPLDDGRRWYRYHHQFRDLLRKRLRGQDGDPSTGDGGEAVAELHGRASAWLERNGFEFEAFEHAAAAGDLDRSERLVAGDGMPLYFRGMGEPVLRWLESLPAADLEARPSLRVALLTMLTFAGRAVDGVAEQLDAAEATLADAEADEGTRNVSGHVAALRAMLAIPESRSETIVAESRRALAYLHPDNLPIRTTAIWTLGFGSQLQGERDVARRAYAEAISLAEASGNTMAAVAAHTSLGQVREAENELHAAVDGYRRVLELAGDPPLPAACEAHLGLARVHYEWNDLDAARLHGEACARLAPRLESVGTPAACAVLLARVALARGEASEAAALLDEAEAFVRRGTFAHLATEVAAARASWLLRQGDAAAAARLVVPLELPLVEARIHLARGDGSAAARLSGQAHRRARSGGSPAELLQALVLRSLALFADGSLAEAVEPLAEAVARAEPGGFVRIFVDEGLPMARFLSIRSAREVAPRYLGEVLAAFGTDRAAAGGASEPRADGAAGPSLYEPLSDLELKVLKLVAEGLSNQEIALRLHRAVSTIKGHNRVVFAKLQVERRTEAVARARELGLL